MPIFTINLVFLVVSDRYWNNHTCKRQWTEMLLILEDSEQHSRMKTIGITTEKLRK